MSDTDIDDEAVRKATGHGWDHWLALHDALAANDHTARVKRFQADHPEVGTWWAQMITVEWERRRGHRVVGQSCDGDFQVSCSKTVPWTLDETWDHIVSTPFVPGADWRPGAAWEVDGIGIEVRRVDPGQMLRWFWHDTDGKSTVEIHFQDKGDKTTFTIRHHGLASAEARERYRRHWKASLELIADA